MSDPADVLSLEPEDLDGHTIDELTDYLEAGCEPADPTIDDSPSCRLALAALARLRDLASTYLDDASSDTTTGPDWIGGVLAAIPVDARPGRSFPVRFDDPRIEATVTEGALRGLVRAVGDGIQGLLVGGVRIGVGDPAPLSVDVALVHGAALPVAVDALRRRLRAALVDQAPFTIGPIDVAVVGLIVLPPESRP
jgi:hypothetical protein